jgi:hypothetical protein
VSVPAKRSAPSSAGEAGPPEKKGKWTPEEDQLAIELRRTGMKWDDIAKRLPGRSAISCRLRYQNYSEKRQDWDEEKKNKLARLYNRYAPTSNDLKRPLLSAFDSKTKELTASYRFKQQMWETIAKEMGLPWRAIEGIHWEMGREEMASRANVPVFQPHAAISAPQRLTPPGPRTNPNLAPAPTPPNESSGEQPFPPRPIRATRARSASTGSHRRARSRRGLPPQLAPLSEGELPQPQTSDPSPNYISDIPNTPASSVEWNGSPAVYPTADDRPQPLTPPHLRRRSSSHHSSDIPSTHGVQAAPPPLQPPAPM